jgi:surfactin synthase thioesterase subunit
VTDLALLGPAADPATRIRLFCFPFAGGSAASYRLWFRTAPPGVQVTAVEYPGHGRRLAEVPVRNLTALARGLADVLEPLTRAPYAVFGHSMGGTVAYAVTRELQRRGAPPPRHLFVSASCAPGGPSNHRPLADLDDTEVVEELRRLGGTPPELLANTVLVEQAVRTLRADSTALATYRPREGVPLPAPVTVFGGRADRLVPVAHLRAWHRLAPGSRLQLFPGDHFFLHTAAREVIGAVAAVLLGPASVGG